MITDNKFKDKKLQYDIKREKATISAFHQVKSININIIQLISSYQSENDRTS